MGLDPRSREILTNEVYKWDSASDSYEFSGRSYLVERIAAKNGITLDRANEEIQKRTKIVDWLAKKNTRNYREVSDVIRRFYQDPEKILAEVEKGE